MKTLRHVTFYFIIFSLLCAITTLSESAPGGFCQVGDVLSSGQSCTDGGTGDDFTVIGGRGQYGFINAATEINLKGNINGKERNFHAKKRADGNWEILSVSAGDTAPPADDDTTIDPGDDETILIPAVTTVKRVVSASVVSPLTEATLDGSIVTLLLTGVAFEQDISKIRDAVTVSGINGVRIDTATVQRLQVIEK